MQVIVNPAAAGGRLGREWPKLEACLGRPVECVATREPGHATELAERAVGDGHDRVIVAGGDGTLCEAAEGLLRAGRGSLGVLPLGTGNDAARALGVPRDFDSALAVATGGGEALADVIRVDGRPVVNAIGVGLTGDINRRAARVKVVRGMTAYLVTAVAAMVRYPSPEVTLEAQGVSWGGRMTMLAVHNGETTGGGFRLTPGASPWDGRLDVCLVPDVPLWGRIPRMLAALRGTLGRWSGTITLRSDRVVLHHSEPLPAHLDGNSVTLSPPRTIFEVESRALRVAVPDGAQGVDRHP